jgi:nucleoside triphosphate diphosphatase
MPDPDVAPLVEIMAQLRDSKTGCTWDRAQTFETIAPYTIEEAYEVADACRRNDLPGLRDELGDLLLQVVFHSQMASEAGAFDLADVIGGICDKMRRRHPHIFGNAETATPWEDIKAEERSGGLDSSALAGVALALPALARAEKLQKRAARTGFDWPDSHGPRRKIDEELLEIAQASSQDELVEEFGDLLVTTMLTPNRRFAQRMKSSTGDFAKWKKQQSLARSRWTSKRRSGFKQNPEPEIVPCRSRIT